MAKLVLVRHGTSEYNEKGLWTGWADPDLNQQGIEEAKNAGKQIKDIKFDQAFVSDLIRAKHTLEIIEQTINQQIPITISRAINERNYGDFTGKNKWEIEKEVGEEKFHEIRRGWNVPIPKGETLKDVYDREIPYYKSNIEPLLKEDKNVIMVSSGNAIRCIVKYLENISDSDISNLEIGLGEVYVYTLDQNLKIISKEIRNENKMRGKI